LLDHQHPLSAGLSLQDVVWGASRQPLEGTPIVLVGDVPLVTESTRVGNRRHLRLRIIPELSNWPHSPDWPIFWANLVYWRRSELPGLESAHGRLGEVLRVRAHLAKRSQQSADAAWVTCRFPDGSEERYPLQQGWAFLPLRQLGVHEVIAGEERWPFAVNMTNPAESDLRNCATGRWGEWVNEEILRDHYQDTGWAFLLTALGLLLLHGWLVWRGELRQQAHSSLSGQARNTATSHTRG
jgi:hypothetical protein